MSRSTAPLATPQKRANDDGDGEGDGDGEVRARLPGKG